MTSRHSNSFLVAATLFFVALVQQTVAGFFCTNCILVGGRNTALLAPLAVRSHHVASIIFHTPGVAAHFWPKPKHLFLRKRRTFKGVDCVQTYVFAKHRQE